MKIKDIIKTYNHPANRNRRLKSVLRYFYLGLRMRIAGDKMFQFNWIDDTKLLVGKKSSSAMLQYLNKLNDMEEMSLMLDFLNEDDTFVDVGANVGVYSILAAGVAGANVICFEPSENNDAILRENIRINKLEDKIRIHNKAVGDSTDPITFTVGLDAVNRIARKEDTTVKTQTLEQTTLDSTLNENCIPSLMKIDVEGYELNVIKGAKKTLSNNQLKVILIETNGLTQKYGASDNEIFNQLQALGFESYEYDFINKKLLPHGALRSNTIFIREGEYVSQKITSNQK